MHYSFVLFLHDISYIFMPGMAIRMLDWLGCPAWLLSPLSLCRAWTFIVSPVSLSFRKWGMSVIWWWDKTHDHEANFFISLLHLFQLMNLCVMFSRSCNIKRFITINLNRYTALNYVRAWRNNFHGETIKFRDSSWNFSFL